MNTRPRGRHARLRSLAMVSAALLPIVGIPSAAKADDGRPGGWKNVHITIVATSAEPRLVETSCNGADATRCVYLVSFKATQAGDFEGQIIEGSAITPTPSGAVSVDAGNFVGTVKGCGTGGFLYTAVQTFGADGSETDVYTVLPGGGTGDLEGMTGRFTVTNDAEHHEPLAGVVRCRRR